MRISNYDYLWYINELAGRRFGDPNRHFVFPWVIDFTSPDSWRDLTITKYRMNKGDEQLDLNYSISNHHITEILSELTYYHYMARKTAVPVLQKYVRTNFRPNEYINTKDL